MNVLLLEKNKIYSLDLPTIVDGSYWINDPQNNEVKLVSIDARNNNWFAHTGEDYKLISDNQIVDEIRLVENDIIVAQNDLRKYLLYIMPTYDKTFSTYEVLNDAEFKIGSMEENEINYVRKYIPQTCGKLLYKDKHWTFNNENSIYVYLNNICISDKCININNGDILFIMGLKIIIINNMILINNPNNLVRLKQNYIRNINFSYQQTEYEEVKELDFYNENDYFFKTPRLRRFINTYEIKIASPPVKQQDEEMPAIFLLGPMITMAMTSTVSLLNIVLKIINGTATLANSWTTLVVAAAMMLTTLLWPNLTKHYKKKMKIKKEQKRQKKYKQYIEEKRKLLEAESIKQREILGENSISLQECYEIINKKQRTLWERKVSQKDFLTARIGVGDVKLDADVKFNEDEFLMEEDDLKKCAEEMINSYKVLKNSPIGYSFLDKTITAIMGIENKLNDFINNIILQLITFHSYDDLKIVIFTNDDNENKWDYIKKLPHCFSNNKETRFFATNEDEYKKLSSYLLQELSNRIQKQDSDDQIENEIKNVTYSPYYLIITDCFFDIRKTEIVEKILSIKKNFGFSFIIKENKLGRLPSECENFISIGSQSSNVLCNTIDIGYQLEFKDEIDNTYDMDKCSSILANIPIEFEIDYRKIPDSLSFLEMYNVGKIEQLNILNRWRLNDSTKSLKAAIGVNDTNNRIYLDLHEKSHGPHGLIAGTTGSGKSEFIITYILSMALNYSPNEVAFILIDYKGGGLAGAFKNEKNNVRLPHLAGTITNLDKNELNRTLVSIDSELKNRQKKFNAAREMLGESTMDIYKYQRLFREKKLDEPIPHLFIICDEFAELKSQQPEFMDNLISTARIGRSLGVHLILATQKPSGVVNDQIWSNSKFRVCLKVQEVADSNEVIKCPDAAELKNPGRFYLQVGYNEVFLLGQSGWCGAQYTPSDNIQKEYDRSIDFIDNIGEVYKNISNVDEKVRVDSYGDEITNILKYISTMALNENLSSKMLWLENIPEVIYIDSLIKKYNFKSNSNVVEAIIGEYDNPSNQSQDILTLQFNSEGNTIIYGMSGIGKEMFIKSIIYSSSIMYSTRDINFYVFDFGSESLRLFSKLPHVGDIVFSGETEKVEKLLNLLNEEIVLRKKMFAEFNGEYETYCKYNNKVPLLVTIINNYDSFKELYSSYEELIIQIAREGKRYGIILIITITNQSGVFSRLTKNFNNIFTLDMNNSNDYVTILGKIGDVLPNNNFDGRGLFKKELAYEFQIGRICSDENLLSFINDLSLKLNNNIEYVPKKIPILPEVVTYDMIKGEITNIKSIPLGIAKEDLKVYNYNFKINKATIISSNEIGNCKNFIKNLLIEFKDSKSIATVLIDTEEEMLELQGYASSYVNSQFDKLLKQLNEFIDIKIVNADYELVIMIAGIERLKLIIDNNEFNKFIEKIKLIDNVTIIFVDSGFKLKKFIFEPWYSSVVSNSNGIWIGPGLIEQTIIKLTDIDKKYKEKINNEYAWIFKNNVGTLVKTINEDGELNEK